MKNKCINLENQIFDFSKIKNGTCIEKSDILNLFNQNDSIISIDGELCTITNKVSKDKIEIYYSGFLIFNNKIVDFWNDDHCHQIVLKFGFKKRTRNFLVVFEEIKSADKYVKIKKIKNFGYLEDKRLLESNKDYTFKFGNASVFIPKAEKV